MRTRDAVASLNLLDLWMEYSRSHSWKEIEGANVGSYWQWYRLASSAHRPGTSLWWPAGQTQGMKDFHTIEWKCVRLQIYSCIQTPIFRRDVSLWRTISVMKDLPQSPLLSSTVIFSILFSRESPRCLVWFLNFRNDPIQVVEAAWQRTLYLLLVYNENKRVP